MIKGRPKVRLEPMGAPWGNGPTADVDVHSLNPALDYLRATQRQPSLSGDPAPTMFATGDLPPFIASGEDPELLRWVHFTARHTAALTSDGGFLFLLIEATADGDPGSMQTSAGRDAWAAYVGRVWRWAIAPVPPVKSPITAESERAFWAGEL